MCFYNNLGMVTVEISSRQVKEYYKLLGAKVPGHVETEQFRKDIL